MAGPEHYRETERLHAQDVHWQAIEVGQQAHATLKGHRPCVVWFTGLSGAGKTTIANHVGRRLHDLGVHTTMLDGDNIRHGLCSWSWRPARRAWRPARIDSKMIMKFIAYIVLFIEPSC